MSEKGIRVADFDFSLDPREADIPLSSLIEKIYTEQDLRDAFSGGRAIVATPSVIHPGNVTTEPLFITFEDYLLNKDKHPVLFPCRKGYRTPSFDELKEGMTIGLRSSTGNWHDDFVIKGFNDDDGFFGFNNMKDYINSRSIRVPK